MWSARPKKWALATLGVMVVAYAVWGGLYLIAFLYASSKYEQISVADTFASVEAKKGLLVSRQVDRTFLGGYQLVFEDLVSDPSTKIVAYGLFGVGFTLIYDSKGLVRARVDNGLDG